MNMNNSCNSCGQNPCQCHTTCITPVACIPPELSHRATATSISAKGLLELINQKCDKEICQLLQIEISLLFAIFELEHLRPDPTLPIVPVDPTDPTDPALPNVPAIPSKKAIQLVNNMVETLEGDLTGKYTSAKLLVRELKTLWDCMANKQQHHGEWDSNFVMRDIQSTTEDLCFYDGDPAVSTIKIIVPVDVGSTVFHTVNGKRCLFESLVDNNIEEPSKMSVLEGKWLNYCDLKEVVDCVLPRAKITAINCADACDDLDGDGIIEGKTMCERMEAVEAYMLAHP